MRFSREELQDFLDRKALELSSSPVSHLRWFLNAIFKLALSDGLVLNNPAAELRIPKKVSAGTGDASADGRGGNGLPGGFRPPGEADFTACNFRRDASRRDPGPPMEGDREDAIRVEQRVYKRVLDTPKNGKMREVQSQTARSRLLKEWAELAQDPAPEAFMFPTEKIYDSPLAGQSVAADDEAEAGDDRPGLGNVSGSAKNQCQSCRRRRRRSEGCF